MIPFSLDESMVLLGRTPTAVRAILDGIPEAWIRTPEPGGWSAFDVVGHLIAGEEHDWIPRARIILDHGESRAFEPFDRFAMFKASEGKSTEVLLDEFDSLRRRSIEDLHAMNLSQADLDRRGMHPDLGPVSMAQLLATWVAHDHSHLSQLGRILARHSREAVGPWKAYLGVL